MGAIYNFLHMFSKSIRSIGKYSIFLFAVVFAACSKDDNNDPVIEPVPESVAFNELSSTGNPDWIELYNYGEEDVDLAGFIVFDDEANKYTLPSGYKIKPGDFLILNCDDQGVDLNLPFKLSSLGESITLQRPDGKMIDHVVFPAMGNGQTYARFPDGSGQWEVTGYATKNKTNGNGAVSYFKNYSYSPEIPMVNDNISFSLQISGGTNVSKIELYYAVDDNSYIAIEMATGDKLNYSATIPALTADGEVYYFFKLTENGGEEVLLPDDAMTDPHDMTITSGEVPSLVINEIMASNQSALADPDGIDEFDDWIEIYNAGTTPVDMGRFYFSDSEDPFDDRIPGDMPEKTTIQPGGYLLFWADSDTEQGPNHLKFKLSADGETLSLYYKDGRLIDKYTFGIQTADVSIGRSPDGSGNWTNFNTPTPGSANQ